MDLDAQLRLARDTTRLRRSQRLRRLWRWLPLPAPLRRRLVEILAQRSKRLRAALQLGGSAESLPTVAAKATKDIAPGPFVLSGYLSEPSGVGRGARLSLQAFQTAGYAPFAHDLAYEPNGWGDEGTGGVWFGHVNAPEAFAFLLRSPGPRNAYRIGYWAWELPIAPAAWGEVASLFHEIWTPSIFVAEAICKIAPDGVKVFVVPHPCPDIGVAADRTRLRLPHDRFIFLTLYDVRSSASRKNPLGALTAFQTAFERAATDVLLVIKVNAASEHDASLTMLREAANGWNNIEIRTDRLSDADASALIASVDVLVSLHRAEGFGLPIAEAMAAGRPVIATAWSGNTDFCQVGVFNIGYRLTAVEDASGIYDPSLGVWAEPDLPQAAQAMRTLAEDRVATAQLGLAGQRHISQQLPSRYALTADVERLLLAAPNRPGRPGATDVVR